MDDHEFWDAVFLAALKGLAPGANVNVDELGHIATNAVRRRVRFGLDRAEMRTRFNRETKPCKHT